MKMMMVVHKCMSYDLSNKAQHETVSYAFSFFNHIVIGRFDAFQQF